MTTNQITLAADDPTVSVTLTLGTIVGGRCIDAGSHDEPPTFEPVTLLDAIVERAADQLVRSMDRDAWHDSLRSKVDAVRTEAIKERLAPMIDAAVEAPIQRTNDYGVPIGEPVTMRDLMFQAVHTEAVRALRRTNNRASYDQTAFDKLLAETVPAVLTKELASELAAAKATLRSAVATSAAQVMADALASAAIK